MLKTAIIGCGSISRSHLQVATADSFCQLVAVADIDANKANETAKKYHCASYTDYEEMLKKESIDVVHILTPHYLHASMAIAAMKQGKHVLVEKPIAISIQDAKEMLAVSRATQKMLGVCFQNRFNTTAVKMKELILSGKVGAVLGAKASVTWHRDAAYYTQSGWRGKWSTEGGGVLINQAIHTLDLLRWLIGDLKSIQGHIDTRLLKNIIEVEDTAEATLRFENDVTAIVFATTCHKTDSPIEIELVCEKAVIRLAEDLQVKYKDGQMTCFSDIDPKNQLKSYWGCGHNALIKEFYTCLKEGKAFAIDALEGLKTLEVVEGIYRASKSGAEIFLGESIRL